MPLSPFAIRSRLAVAFFFQAAVVGLWTVNFPVFLRAFELGWLIAYTGAIAGVSSLVAPMFGALADDKVPAERLFGGLCIMASGLLVLMFYLIEHQVAWGWVVLVMSFFWLLYTPTWSLLTSICFANLPNKESDFPIIRAIGTVGWMVAGLATSYVLHSDQSPLSGYVSAGVLLSLGCYAFCLPSTPPLGKGPRSLRRILGLEALSLLANRDQRVFFLTTLMMALPLAAFYPYTPRLLESLGKTDVAGAMTLGQVLEIVAMLTLVSLMKRLRIKTLISLGLIAALLRYAFYLVGVHEVSSVWVMIGLSLHGIAYTFHMITGQIFLERRVEPGQRGQAQSLLASVNGIGGVIGSLLVGQWFLHTIERTGTPRWIEFWSLLAILILGILIYFMRSYRGLPATNELDAKIDH